MFVLKIGINTDGDFGWDFNDDDEVFEKAINKELYFNTRKEAVDFLIEHLKRVTSTFRPANGRLNIQEWYTDFLNDVSKSYYREYIKDNDIYEYKDFGNQSVIYVLKEEDKIEKIEKDNFYYYTKSEESENDDE